MLMREKHTKFSINVRWVEGKTHMIVDTLSNAPVFQPEEEEEETLKAALSCLQAGQTEEQTDIEAVVDEGYITAWKNYASFHKLPDHHTARKQKKMFEISSSLQR